LWSASHSFRFTSTEISHLMGTLIFPRAGLFVVSHQRLGIA
jgi:hypothetical protein